MSSTGTITSRSSSFRAPASTISTSRRVPPRKAPIASSGRWVADRPMRCGSAAARWLSRSRLSARCDAALRGGDGVHLVDDDVLDAAQDLPRLAGEEQVERLGRGDEDVGRVFASARRASAGVSPVRLRDGDLRHGLPQPLGRAPDPGQRRAQVALDVVGQGLERADVEHADRPLRRCRLGHEPIEAPQEGGEGLAAAGRGMDQGVRAAADRAPAELLGAGRLGERLANQVRVGSLKGASGSLRRALLTAMVQSIGPSGSDRFLPRARHQPAWSVVATAQIGPSWGRFGPPATCRLDLDRRTAGSYAAASAVETRVREPQGVLT